VVIRNKIVDTYIGISYADDPQKAVEVIRQVLADEEEVAKTPQPLVGIDDFADSSINIGMRYWVPTIKYFETKYRINMSIHLALQQAAITIPFPQRDVHLITNEMGKIVS
jgi:small conductance mechanosensitive channel